MNTLREVLSNVKKVSKNAALGSCWEWCRAKTTYGYGKASWRGALVDVHRLVYGLLVEELKPRMVVRHLCDNPCCCNPSHLVQGTQLENMKDWAFSGKFGHRKLFEHDVIEIRRLDSEGVKQAVIASLFGVTTTCVSQACRGATGRHFGCRKETSGLPIGSNHKNAKLNEVSVSQIKALLRDGVPITDIATSYGVSSGAISFIKHGKTWRHVA